MEKYSLYKLLGSIRQFRLFRSALFIIIAGSLLLIINEYVFRIRFTVWEAVPYIFYWLVIAATFSILFLIPWRRYAEDSERLMAEVFIAGLAVGLVIAVYKIFVYYQLWTLFNLLAEPIRTALFGLLVVWVLKEKSRTLTMTHIMPR